MRSAAWTVSVVVHGAVVLALLLGIQRVVPEKAVDPDRLVFLEPAAPPPPPAAGEGTGDFGKAVAAPDPEPAEQSDRLVAIQREAPTARPTVPRRVRASPPPQPTPRRAEPEKRAAEDSQVAAIAGSPAVADGREGGVAGGEQGGVVGGTLGGLPGGALGGSGSEIVRAEVAAKPPMILERVLPEYPRSARAQRVEGLVVLRAVVDKEGRVEDEVIVLASIPPLDDAAVNALRQWKFTPGRDATGAPVRVQIDMPIRFQLP